MKKHLIAAAVAGALAVPAMAQVTVSGRIDTSVASMESTAGVKTSQVRSSFLTTNQIVFSGSEDLGGGLSANFIMASNLISEEDTAWTMGDRGFLVGLAGGFGSIQLGKNTGDTATGVVTSGVLGNATPMISSLTARPDNSVIYTTPAIGGFSFKVAHSFGDTNGEDTDPATNESTDYSISGTVGPVKATLGYADHDLTGPATSGSQLSFIANVNLDFATLNIRYQDQDMDAAAGNDTEAYGVGVSVPFGDGLTGLVEYTDIDATTNTDYSRIAVGVVKTLSKRTNVYAAYYNDDQANTALTDSNAFAVGVRHSF